jgi:hypothetical protein
MTTFFFPLMVKISCHSILILHIRIYLTEKKNTEYTCTAYTVNGYYDHHFLYMTEAQTPLMLLTTKTTIPL